MCAIVRAGGDLALADDYDDVGRPNLAAGTRWQRLRSDATKEEVDALAKRGAARVRAGTSEEFYGWAEIVQALWYYRTVDHLGGTEFQKKSASLGISYTYAKDAVCLGDPLILDAWVAWGEGEANADKLRHDRMHAIRFPDGQFPSLSAILKKFGPPPKKSGQQRPNRTKQEIAAGELAAKDEATKAKAAQADAEESMAKMRIERDAAEGAADRLRAELADALARAPIANDNPRWGSLPSEHDFCCAIAGSSENATGTSEPHRAVGTSERPERVASSEADTEAVADRPVDVLDLPLPPVGERSVPIYIAEQTFGPGSQPRDEHELREMKTYVVWLLRQHEMDVDGLLGLKRHFWREFMHDQTLRRLYEAVPYPANDLPRRTGSRHALTLTMREIMQALVNANEPMDWPAIQQAIGGVHGAVLVGVLNAMEQRGLIVKLADDRYLITPQT
jgi:hypothetical protein